MAVSTDRNLLVSALPQFGIHLQRIPKEVVTEAMGQNPWFTKYYIKTAIENLLPWFSPEGLQNFLAKYPPREKGARRVGIIMAGNLPLVGFHDLLITWLSGHIAVVKPSHQDTVLMRWVIDTLTSIIPELADRVELVSQVNQVDYLLATGTDNSNRYFRSQYRELPSTIRGNRLSVALIPADQKLSEDQLFALASDMLLYNGLGCRNVSNMLVPKDWDMRPLLKTLESYPSHKLNPLYMKKVLREQAIMRLKGGTPPDSTRITVQWGEQIRPVPMGVINFVPYSYVDEAAAHLDAYRDGIQCVLRSPGDLGKTQCPDLDDFADGVNTMEILQHLP